MAFRGMEQIPDAEECPVLERWIQKLHFCQIWGQLAHHICNRKVSLAEKWNVLFCWYFWGWGSLNFLLTLGTESRQSLVWAVPQEWGQTTIFKWVWLLSWLWWFYAGLLLLLCSCYPFWARHLCIPGKDFSTDSDSLLLSTGFVCSPSSTFPFYGRFSSILHPIFS